MPHIILEHNIDLTQKETIDFLQDLNIFLSDSEEGKFNLEDCKARAIYHPDAVIGSGNKQFFHINIKILEGRSQSLRKALAQGISEKAKVFLSSHPNQIDITVIIEEMEKEVYQKSSISGLSQTENRSIF